MSDCVFCKIVNQELPASTVYEDELMLAFLDVAPANTGHLLVIPKRHLAAVAELDEATGMHLFRITVRLMKALAATGLNHEGSNLHLADGKAADQEVPHVHLHVIPRFEGDDIRIDFPGIQRPTREELEATAARIRDAVEALAP